jgi:peptidase E
MNTTYILHGGETSRNIPDNDLFFKYFTHFVEKDEVQILMCYFAKDKAIWEARLETDRKKIAQQTTRKVSLSLAKDPEDLLNKIDTADVLYVAGGDPEPLESYLSSLKDLKEKLKGKVYIGCSMGAFIVSSHYVLSFETKRESEVHNGLDLLPINTLCHWDIEEKKETKINLLKNFAPEKPIVTLNECKFAIFIN